MTDSAFRLAAILYKGPLRPARVDDAHARALAGEEPPKDAPHDLHELWETRGAVHGEDAPSRRLLSSLASQLGVSAIVVVSSDAGKPVARVYLADTSSFDAARYTEDPNAKDAWAPAVASLERSLHVESPKLAQESPPPPPKEPTEASRPFYKSPWFWGAIGAAVFAGGAIYFATRDNSDSSGPIHLVMKVPR
jgi:hypothetical protein